VIDIIWAVSLLVWLAAMGLLVTNVVNRELDDPYNYWSERGWLGRVKRDNR
jgi:hypothetical protein